MASKRVVNPKSGAVPKQPRGGSAGPSRPGSRPSSAGSSRPSSARTPKPEAPPPKKGLRMPPPCPKAAEALRKKAKMEPAPPPRKMFDTPAFSIPLTRKETNPFLAEQGKKKTIRRNIPPGEDIAEMKRIIGSLKDKTDITVGEFIALIAPSTGDNGELLRTVLNDDMNSFRNLARKIYDTMTQDVSDVLTNQHIQLKEYEQEKITLYTEKMMRAINEIYSYASKFDFEEYYRDSEGYLGTLFPVPRVIEKDSEEAEMHRRQQAYHRLNWLKTEGERLAAENSRLQARLNELKREQQEEMISAETREAEAEARRAELQAQEAAAQQQLENLSEKVEKTLIDTEAAIRVATDEANILAPLAKKEAAKAMATKRRRKKPGWSTEAAAEIEEIVIEETIVAEGAQAPVEPEDVAGAIQKVRSRTSRTKFKSTEQTTPERGAAPRKPRSPFHFSPIKTPPSKAPPPKEKSPFHFSPLKTPPAKVQTQRPPSPFHYSPPRSPARPEPAAEAPPPHPPQLHTTRLRTERVTVQERTRRSGLFPSSDLPEYTPAGGLRVPPGGGAEDVTPIDQPIPRASQRTPHKEGVLAPQRPDHTKLPELVDDKTTPLAPAPRRGREYAPKDSWGGFY